MTLAKKCPECGSDDIQVVEYRGTKARICGACGFDERDELDAESGEKVSQKAKEKHTVYRSGGPRGKR